MLNHSTIAFLDTASQAADGVVRLVDAAVGRLFDWRHRALAMEEFQALDDHMLRDLGLSRSDVMALTEADARRRFANDNAISTDGQEHGL